jgi:hypothetical protein
MVRILSAALVALCLVPSTTPAQSYPTDRGSWIVGGHVSFASQRGRQAGMTEPTETVLEIMPNVQYFVVPGLAVGVEGALARARAGDTTVSLYGGGPALTYYFGRDARAWHPYLGTTAQMGWLKSTYEGDSTLTTIGAMGGVLLMLGPGVGLDTRLFHDWQSSRDPTTSGGRWTTMGLAVGIAAFL